MTEAEAEAGLRKMAAEVGDPLGGVLRSLLNMLDAEREKVRGFQAPEYHHSESFESGRRLERVHVLRWLRETGRYDNPWNLGDAADCIERGEHVSDAATK
jgi:hypothetical protein